MEVQKAKAPRDRRPTLAALVNKTHSKVSVEDATGLSISNDEWKNINIHAMWPGEHQPVVKDKISRMRVTHSGCIDASNQSYLFTTRRHCRHQMPSETHSTSQVASDVSMALECSMS